MVVGSSGDRLSSLASHTSDRKPQSFSADAQKISRTVIQISPRAAKSSMYARNRFILGHAGGAREKHANQMYEPQVERALEVGTSCPDRFFELPRGGRTKNTNRERLARGVELATRLAYLASITVPFTCES